MIRKFPALALSLSLVPLASASAQAQTPKDEPVSVVASVGHSSSVRKIAFSPNGKWLASGGQDRVVKIWDAETRRLLRTWKEGTDSLTQLTITPDSKMVVTRSYEGNSVRVWDPETGQLLRTLDNPDDSYLSDDVFVATRQNRLITVFRQGLRIWDLSSGRVLNTIRDGDRPDFTTPISMALSPDERWIAIGYDKEYGRTFAHIVVRDSATGREVARFDGHTGQVNAVAFSPDGTKLASGSADKTVKVWDLTSRRLLSSYSDHSNDVTSVSFSTDGRLVVSGGYEKFVRIRDIITDAARAIDADSGTSTIAVSPDGRSFASSGYNVIKLWTINDGRLLGTMPTQGDVSRATVFAAKDGKYFVDQWQPGLQTWDMTTGQRVKLRPYTDNLQGIVSSASRDASGATKFLRHVKGYSTLSSWDGESEQRALSFVPTDDTSMRVVRATLSSDGRRAAAAIQKDPLNRSAQIKLWESDGRSLATIAEPAYYGVYDLQLSPDGSLLVWTSGDKSPKGKSLRPIKIWDVRQGRLRHTISDAECDCSHTRVSPDGQSIFIFGGGAASNLQKYDTRTGRLVWKGKYGRLAADGHFSSDYSIDMSFSPDGGTLLLPSANTPSIFLQNASTGTPIRELVGNVGSGVSAMFSEDGSRFVVGNDNGTTSIWDSKSGERLAFTVHARSGEWVTITPEGFFVASDEGASLVHVVQGFTATGVEQVYQALYRPDLVREKLAGDPKGLVRDAAAKMDLKKVIASGAAPKVSIATPVAAAGGRVADDEVTVEASITEQNGGGIGKIEWRVNGVTLGVESRGVQRLPDGPASRTQSVKRTLSLEPGENRIEVVAYNGRDLIASEPARIAVTWDGQKTVAPPKLHVLAVAVNDYYDSRLKLSYAVPDARALSDALKKAGSSMYGEVEVTSVLDDKVTIDNLDKVFAEVGSKIHPRDVFVFFLAGHGKTVDGRYHFLPQDFRYENEDSIVKRGIDQDRFQAWFARIAARKSILLYDTCESGSLTGDRIQQRGIERVTALEKMTRAMGRTVLSASSDDAPALEGYRGHGVFTYALLDGMSEADTNGNGLIEVTELAAFVDQKVPELSFQAFKMRQIPQMKIVGNSFPIVSKASVRQAEGGRTETGTSTPPAKPTHVVASQSPLRVFAAATSGDVVQQLMPGALVTVEASENGRLLVVQDGKRLGFVDEKALAKLQ